MNLLLTIRAILNVALAFILLSGAIALLLQGRNGISHALSASAILGAMYTAIVIIISVLDVCSPEMYAARGVLVLVWDTITGLLILSLLYLGYKMLTEKDEHERIS